MTCRLACLALCVVACVTPPAEDRSDSIAIGVLLPFTGDIAATGTNAERALILAVERLNKAGGVAGKRLRLVARDEHSDIKRGLEEARALIDDDHVVAIIGPESEDLAKSMVPLIKAHKIVQISGGVTSPSFTTIDDDGYWFRTTPAANLYASALVGRMQADGIARAVVLYVSDEFGTGFANGLIYELSRSSIHAPAPISFQPGERTYKDTINRALASTPDAVVLVAYPKSSAAIVREWGILGGTGKWYLAPSLKAEVFINNVPPGLLAGAVGVSPAVAADAQDFAQAFAARWSGDRPLPAAFFYYDAAAVLNLAIASAARNSAGAVPSGDAIRDALTALSRPPGDSVAWHELDRALALVQAGQEIDYRGVSGEVDLDDRGDVQGGRVEFWTIRDDKIENESR